MRSVDGNCLYCPHRARHDKRTRRRRHLEELIRERTSLLRESRTQAALLAAKFHSVFQQAPLGIALTNLEGHILDANLALYSVLHCEPHELVGRRFADFIHASESGQANVDVELKTTRGEKVNARCSTALVKDEDGTPLFGVLMVEDRTMQKETERALHLASIVVSSSADAIFTSDLHGIITSWNPAADKKFGLSQAEAKGANMWRLLPQEFAEAAASRLQYILGPTDFQTFETTCSPKDGHTLDVSATIAPLYDEDGHPSGWAVTTRDITDLKRINREMARFDRLSTLGEMAAGMGHEVRNPMTTVRGYLQLLHLRPEFAPYARFFHLMIEELDRMNGIITAFLSVGCDKEDRQSPYKLGAVITEIRPLLEAEALLRDMNLHIDICDEEISLLLNTTEIRQLLFNLVRNGMDSMVSGGHLRLSTEQQGQKVVLGVEDTGCGIPPEVIAKMYTPFLTTKENGTGLGLSICHNIARRHNADIHVAYTSPAGTRFEVVFPIPPRVG